jgi:AcrR family transcriptional regulator
MSAADVDTISTMSRWEPNAPERLQRAAFELYTERGYDQTTVAQIAARAGLTERTFFRHFADKREVLFDGGDRFATAVVEGIEGAPSTVTALDAVVAGIVASRAVLPAVAIVRARNELIFSSPELHERELIKLASLSDAMRKALRRRDVSDSAAELAAETGIALLRVAMTRWLEDPAEASWEHHVHQAADDLRLLANPRPTSLL